MSVDKRTVHTDALETLGSIIGDGEGRDAIHLAVEPVEAGERLYPGQDIRLNDEKKAVSSTHADSIGIVDPFLQAPVYIGQKFWLVVHPRQITSLRHVWTHPAFDPLPHDLPCSTVGETESPNVAAAREWIANFAEKLGYTYDRLMIAARDWANYGTWEYDNTERYKDHWEDFDQFWIHYETVTGEDVDESDKHSFFTCSC